MLRKSAVQRRFAGKLVVLALTSWWLGAQPTATAQEVEGPRELGRIRAKYLSELSGLAASRKNPNVVWVHNDGGYGLIYAVTTGGKLAAEVRVRTRLEDVEDIAIGPGPEKGVDYIYLGDIGDNDTSRRQVRVVRFAEPALDSGDERIKAAGIEEFLLKYPDGSHDAEALLVDPVTGDLFIVTKEDERSRLYRVAADALKHGAAATLELADRLNVGDVSAADISRAGDLIILRSEDRGWLWSRAAGESVAASFRRAPRRVMVRGPGQAENGEAVGFSPDGRSYYTVSEGEREAIYVFPLPAGAVDGGGRAGTAR